MALDSQTGMDPNSDQGLISEHESGVKTKKSNEQINIFQPSEEQKKTIRLGESIFARNKKARGKYDKTWLEDYQIFRGDQWKQKRPSYRHSEVINLVFQTIQSTVPMMTDARPKFEFLAQEPNDQAIADILNHLSQADWEKYNWSGPLLEVIYDANFYGTGFGIVDYDEKELDGIGAVMFESEDPFFMYPDPNARVINDNGRRSRNFVKAEPVDVDRLKGKYPKFAKYFKADLDSFSRVDRELRTDDDAVYVAAQSDVTLLENSQRFGDSQIRPQALEITIMLKDKTVITETVQEPGEVDPLTGQPTVVEKKVKRLKYPKGRKIVLVNRIPVVDEEMEFDDKKFPYFKLNNYILPREFWGISEIEQLKGPQRTFNKLVSFALDVLTLMGNPVWVVDTDSGVDTSELYNKPGLVVEKSRGSEVRREAGTQLQPYVLQLIDRFKSWFDDVGGSKDVSRGAADGVTAARAIEALQEAANTRVRQKTRLLDRALQNFGQMYAARVFQFYKAPRIFRLTADDQTEKFFKMSIDQDGEGNPTVRFNGFDDEGKPTEIKELGLSREFDVRVSTGSSLTIAKKQQFQDMLNLFDRGIVTEVDVLEASDIPNVPKIVERLEERKAKEAEALAAQEQQAAGAESALSAQDAEQKAALQQAPQ